VARSHAGCCVARAHEGLRPVRWIRTVAIVWAAILVASAQLNAQTLPGEQHDSAGPSDSAVANKLSAAAAAPRVAESCPLGSNRRAAQSVVGGVFVGSNVALYRYFKRAWWSGEKADKFFFNADWDEAFRDQDKWGHVFGGYHLTRAGHTLLRGACVSPKKSLFYSALYATLFQLQIELWDGQYAKYGFSYPDFLANTAGMGLAVLHAAKPRTQVIKPTISYRQTAAMRQRVDSDELRHSTDYAGQTYWFSTDVDALLPERAQRYWPGIVRFSVGHSITDWVLPRPAGVEPPTPQQVVRAQRRILLSLDLDAGKLPGNHPAWRFIKRQLSYIRLPAPALEIAPRFDGIGWYR
jgi:uncharacterized protein YfiM (DUF2279 family)